MMIASVTKCAETAFAALERTVKAVQRIAIASLNVATPSAMAMKGALTVRPTAVNANRLVEIACAMARNLARIAR